MKVCLNVYDLSPANRWLSWAGVGVYHSEVVLGTLTYTFSEEGVIVTSGRTASEEQFKEQIEIGAFEGNRNEMNGVINGVREDFPPGSYNLVSKNCNHFASALCQALCGRDIPAWVNRAASVSSLLVPPGADTRAGAAGAERKESSDERPELSAKQRQILAKIRAKT